MEPKKITDALRQILRKPLPAEAVKQHPTKTFLSTIKAIYVTERFNDVFGVGGWQLKVNHITTTESSMVVVKVEFSVPEYGIYYECFGGNDNGGEKSKNFDLGDAYKGATTDAITKIGSYLEVGIDVFKGKQSHQEQPKKEKAPAKEWLDEDHQKWNDVIAAVKGKYTIEQVKEKYNVSQRIETLLTELKNKK